MIDDTTILTQIDEIDLPADTPEARARRKARRKVPALPKWATRSPHFNVVRRSVGNVGESGRVVRQPAELPAFAKPLKPPGRRP